MCGIGNPVKYWVGFGLTHLVPTNLWYLQLWRCFKFVNDSRQNPEALDVSLLAKVKQNLDADTYSQHRFAGFVARLQHVRKPVRVEVVHSCARGADTRENHLFG